MKLDLHSFTQKLDSVSSSFRTQRVTYCNLNIVTRLFNVSKKDHKLSRVILNLFQNLNLSNSNGVKMN